MKRAASTTAAPARGPLLRGAAVAGAALLGFSCGNGGEVTVRAERAPEPQAAESRPNARTPAPELPPRPARSELPGGLVVEIEEPGPGRRPAALGRRVTMHWTGRVAGAAEPFASTLATGIPDAFTLGRGEVVRGLDRALAGARVGDRLRVHVPASLAYGERGQGAIPPGADLSFEIRILRID